MARAKARMSCSFFAKRHFRVAEDHRLAAAVGQIGRGVFHRHGARQSKRFLGAYVRRHADAADGRTAGDVVDGDHRFEAMLGIVDVDDFYRTQFVGKFEDVFHNTSTRFGR